MDQEVVRIKIESITIIKIVIMTALQRNKYLTFIEGEANYPVLILKL